MASEKKPVVAVAMSGGVDSSVTAALLKRQGFEVIGITMQLFAPRSTGSGSAAHDAAAVARHLGIPHHVIGLETDFRHLIIQDFIDEYRCGRTPNPCVRCNRYVKFGLLLEQARAVGADLLATGHYVRNTIDSAGVCHLRQARCIGKDQSYFLYTLSQEQLSQVLFPLGEMASKDEVRRLAHEFALPVADKGDSQEVCFIPDDDYVAFLEESGGLAGTPGDIVHVGGQVVGRHRGTHRYTIGQRKGLGVAWNRPLYVTAIDTDRNVVVVGEEEYLAAAGLLAAEVGWIVPPDGEEFETACKIRYRHHPVACRVRLLPESRCEVRFDEPQRAVTPGQSVVFYRGDEVLGGGKIAGAIGPSAPCAEQTV
ncbi:tRNA 2-thiouridine(34) synthase MnmA [Oryzomonas japonica]|uniref:tRNA-specific 2-thiouridylase MnmA n=1 Tax=Oryzomonas japonica TaxID=2603858 RepID=A0A7J4ZSA4_9BACT|nr:tRNA 2-thiouridine(34) synthase MnmA [Oryzomonas japonica]KAB0666174.1 tRNA 2-thiouridine(34) synthase MnmA [Oryzomonas japonica]